MIDKPAIPLPYPARLSNEILRMKFSAVLFDFDGDGWFLLKYAYV